MSQSAQDPKRRLLLRRFLRLSGALAATLAAPRLLAAPPAVVKGIRANRDGGVTRIAFDLSAPTHHRLFTLRNPERVVIDFDNARAASHLKLAPTGPIRRLRYAPHHGGLRVVLDLSQRVQPRSLLLEPAGRHHDYRLAVDLASRTAAPAVHTESKSAPLRDVVVAIDPGHGGKDPGAIGHHGTEEKHVVLAIGQRLATLIGRQRGMRPLLIRDGDYFVSLGHRVSKARKHRADLFVSIHADACPYHYVKGSTVYVLSEHGASSEAARLLAKRQNEADRVAGVSLADKDRLLASVLVDLEQTATYESSLALGQNLTDSIADVVPLHSRHVEHAAFAVLKSPDIPSVLVETAFISNPAQERRLRTSHFQHQMADALMSGIDGYFRRHAPPGTRLANHHGLHAG